MSSLVFAADLYDVGGFTPPAEQLRRLRAYGADDYRMLFQHLLFYDTVHIGCESLMFLIPLLERFPVSSIQSLFESGVLRITRIQGKPIFGAPGSRVPSPGDFGMISDVSNSPGGPSINPKNLEDDVDQFCGKAGQSGVRVPSRDSLLKHGQNLELDDSGVFDLARDLVRTNPMLARWAGCRMVDGEARLPIVPASTAFAGPHSRDAMRTPATRCAAILQGVVVRWAAQRLGAVDSSTHAIIGDAIRTMEPTRPVDAPTSVFLETVRLPDVAGYILDNPDRIDEFVKLRNSRSAERFRVWFREECVGRTAGDVAAAYLDVASTAPWTSSLPARVIRFIATTFVGSQAGLPWWTSTGISAVDAFVIDSMVKPHPVRQYVHNLRQFAHLRPAVSDSPPEWIEHGPPA